MTTISAAAQEGPPPVEPLGEAFTINATTLGDQTAPSVAPSVGGGFAVLWHSSVGMEQGISARRVDAAGEPVGEEIVLEALQGEDDLLWPRLARRGESELLAAWSQFSGGFYDPPLTIRPFDVEGRIFSDLESPGLIVGLPPVELDLAAFSNGDVVLAQRRRLHQ